MPRPIVFPSPPPLVTPGAAIISVGVTFALLAMAMLTPRGSGEIGHRDGVTREVRYLLPLLPPHKKVQGTGSDAFTDLKWGGSPLPKGIDGTLASGGGQVGTGRGRRGKSAGSTNGVSPLPVPDSEPTGGPVYVASELDQPVRRDPASAAPHYPPFLESQHIEGAVVVSYVVDTTGLADSVSLHVQMSSHPAFSEAVRAALPGMRFRPAELGGHPVRQLVQQEFRFVIVASSDSVVRAAALAKKKRPRKAS